MNKIYLKDIKIISSELHKFKENDIIIYEMPPFCSGDYEAKVYKDKKGLYIKEGTNFFPVYCPIEKVYGFGCRDYCIKHSEK